MLRILAYTLMGSIYLSFAGSSAEAQQQTSTSGTTTTSPQEMVNQYCITCHNDAQWEREMVPFSFEAVDFENSGDPDPIGAHPDLWERVVRKMRLRMMPPPGRPSAASPCGSCHLGRDT